MPAVSGIMQTYDRVGEKEDIEDIIYRIDREDTPLLSSIGTTRVANRLHQWQTLDLATPASVPVLEGAPAGSGSERVTTMLSAYTQIFKNVAEVSDTALAVPAYGRGNELAEQILLAGIEQKRNKEFACVGANQSGSSSPAATSSSNDAKGTARALTSAQHLVDSTSSNTSGSNRNLTEALILDVLKKTYTNGGKPNLLMVTPNHSITVSEIAKGTGSNGTVQRDFGTSTKIVNHVDVYVSPLGQVKVVPNWLMQENSCLVLDTRYWKRGVLRPMKSKKMSVDGDSEKSMVISEDTLICNAPKSSGKIDKLNA